MMSVHEALEAWQAGKITAKRAMDLTDAAGLIELYDLARACDVEIQIDISDEEGIAAAARGETVDLDTAIKQIDAAIAEGLRARKDVNSTEG